MTVELVNAETGEVVDSLTEPEARRLTERIRVALDRVSTAWADLAERITEAYQRRADLALGYRSWAEYAEAELKPSGAIAAEVRRELVAMLSAQGMSNRAIAPTVGVSEPTVRRDAQQVRHGDAPAPDPVGIDGGEAVTPTAPRPRDGAREIPAEPAVEQRESGAATPPAPRTVTGLDGKTYPRPESKTPPRRTSLAPQVQTAGWELTKAVERIQRLAADDRFNSHKDEMAPHLRSHLTNAIEVFQDLLDRINNN